MLYEFLTDPFIRPAPVEQFLSPELTPSLAGIYRLKFRVRDLKVEGSRGTVFWLGRIIHVPRVPSEMSPWTVCSPCRMIVFFPSQGEGSGP